MKFAVKIGLICFALSMGCGDPDVSTPTYSGGEVRFNHDDGYAKSVVAIKTKRGRSDLHITCGGVVVKDRWVLTAAHCVMPVNSDDATVGPVFSKKNIRVQLQEGVDYEIEDIIYPKQFSAYRAHVEGVDIALVKTKEALPLGRVAEIGDAETFNSWLNENFLTGMLLRGIGYGNRNGSIYSGGQLNYLDIPYVSTYGPLKSISTLSSVHAPGKTNHPGYAPLEFMAGVHKKVACHGDSGGAAFFLYKGTWYLKGIASRALTFETAPEAACGTYSLTAIYADVTAIQGWIEAKTSGS